MSELSQGKHPPRPTRVIIHLRAVHLLNGARCSIHCKALGHKLQIGEALPCGELRDHFGGCRMTVNKSTVNSNMS